MTVSEPPANSRPETTPYQAQEWLRAAVRNAVQAPKSRLASRFDDHGKPRTRVTLRKAA
jgi:pyridoxine/pyridoxamine 5'-phosphate oxidase